jgi:hypothetical protein
MSRNCVSPVRSLCGLDARRRRGEWPRRRVWRSGVSSLGLWRAPRVVSSRVDARRSSNNDWLNVPGRQAGRDRVTNRARQFVEMDRAVGRPALVAPCPQLRRRRRDALLGFGTRRRGVTSLPPAVIHNCRVRRAEHMAALQAPTRPLVRWRLGRRRPLEDRRDTVRKALHSCRSLRGRLMSAASSYEGCGWETPSDPGRVGKVSRGGASATYSCVARPGSRPCISRLPPNHSSW